MTKKMRKYLNEISDDENPEYLFNGIHTKIVSGIAAGKIDAVKIAKKEMVNRGFDKRGKWIGFDSAKKYWKL